MMAMLKVVILLGLAAAVTIPVQCDTVFTLLNSSSYAAYDGWVLNPGGFVSLAIRTYKLNSTVLYMQGGNDTFVYLHLVNGRMSLTVNDGSETKVVSLQRPFNTNSPRNVELTSTQEVIQLVDADHIDGVNVSIDGPFNILSPVYVGGIPDTPPFPITHDQAMTNDHLVGCVQNVIYDNGTTPFVDPPNQSMDVVIGECVEACNATDCNPVEGVGTCIEFYTHGACDCREVADAGGDDCTGPVRVLDLRGNYYTCYSVPLYSSPSTVNDTVSMFLREPQSSGTLMTGRQGEYQFSLYIENSRVHYKVFRGVMELLNVTATEDIAAGILRLTRSANSVSIDLTNDTGTVSLAMHMVGIVGEELSDVRFTDICVGGGSLTTALYNNLFQEVYYNLFYLSDNAMEFSERNVSTATRVNFTDSNAQFVLPGNLAGNSATNIQISFRTSQQDAILLHSEDGNNYVRVYIRNSLLTVEVMYNGDNISNTCNLNITGTQWYTLVVEPIISPAIDSASMLMVRLDGISCDIMTNLVNNFASVPLVVGGMAGGIDGFMGCLEMIKFNFVQLNLDVVLSEVIHTSSCEPCDIQMPCLNGGSCAAITNRTFNCSCIEPYFGEFCGMEMVISSTIMMTSTVEITSTLTTSSSIPPTTTSASTTTTTIISSSLLTTSQSPSPTTSVDTTSLLSSSSTSPSPSGTVSDEGDDSNVGTIIGIVLAIIVGLLLILLVILIFIVVLRNRSSRQGFYKTDEGKGGEEMILKYSASLRSITKPGSAGAENGGTLNSAAKKEQEYYM